MRDRKNLEMGARRKPVSAAHLKSLERRQWRNVPGGRGAQTLLGPILQEMMVEDKERREAHLHDIRNKATRGHSRM